MSEQTYVDQVLDPAQRLTDVAHAIVEALRPLIDLARREGDRLHQRAQDRYHEAGAPYGDTHDGLVRWWHELFEAERLRGEAETILARQQQLAWIRATRF